MAGDVLQAVNDVVKEWFEATVGCCEPVLRRHRHAASRCCNRVATLRRCSNLVLLENVVCAVWGCMWRPVFVMNKRI